MHISTIHPDKTARHRGGGPFPARRGQWGGAGLLLALAALYAAAAALSFVSLLSCGEWLQWMPLE